MKTIRRPSRRAFFNGRPVLVFPAADGPFVALQSATNRSLATPPQLLEDPIYMVRMVAHAGLALDQVGHARGGPQRRGVPEGLRTVPQGLFNLLALGRIEAGFAAGAAGFSQAADALRFPSSEPATGRLSTDAQATCDRRLGESVLEELSGAIAPLLQPVEIPLHAVEVSRVCIDTTTPKTFTVLCRTQ